MPYTYKTSDGLAPANYCNYFENQDSEQQIDEMIWKDISGSWKNQSGLKPTEQEKEEMQNMIRSLLQRTKAEIGALASWEPVLGSPASSA